MHITYESNIWINVNEGNLVSNLLSLLSVACYEHICKANYLVLNSQLVGWSSLEKTDALSVVINCHSLYMGVDLCDFPYSHWHINWCCHCSGNHIVENFMGTAFLSYIQDTILQQRFCAMALTIIHPLFHYVWYFLCLWCQVVCSYINLGLVPHGQLFSALLLKTPFTPDTIWIWLSQVRFPRTSFHTERCCAHCQRRKMIHRPTQLWQL